MFLLSKKSSIHNSQQNQIFLSKKHIITEEQLSQLCSQSKQSRSSNLFPLVTKSKQKLNTLSKRSILPSDTIVPSTQKITSSIHQTKSSHQTHNKQNFLQTKQQMNLLYEQNQKLGYRINYLNDENNFFKISINNIQKLNSNIHKHLDGHQLKNGVKNKIDTRKPGNRKDSVAGGLINGVVNYSLGDKGRNANSKSSYMQHSNNTQPINSLQPTLPAASGVSSSFSLISNKIHLKNLQMKVGNSIRKTQKLKKIYEGSISSLTKKAEQLQTDINKLSRQAEYYEIESELLSNIYKADYYMHLNQEWIELMGKEFAETYMESSSKRQRQLDSLEEVSDEDPNTANHNNNDSDDDYLQYLKKDSQLISKFKKKQPLTSPKASIQYLNTRPNKIPSIQQSGTIKSHSNEFIRTDKGGENVMLNPGLNRNFVKEFNTEGPSMAIRFMSGSYNKTAAGSFKNGWYSAMCTKGKNNKMSPLMMLNNLHAATTENHDKRQSKTSKPTTSNPPSSYQPSPYNTSRSFDEPPKPPTEKELLLLPQELIQAIISSLEKQEIQQANKLESLRKEEREQKKKNCELLEEIEKLSEEKEKLKILIEQEFAAFFMNSVNTMQTLNSFSNTAKKPTFISIASSNPKQLPSVSNLTPKSRNLSRPSSTLKPTPYLSIQQRKQQADQLYICSLYEKQLLESIQKQDKLLQEQYKVNQEYKQKIIDRNEQENKELKVLQEEVNKCMDQVKEIKTKYRVVCQAKGKIIGSSLNVADVGGQFLKSADN